MGYMSISEISEKWNISDRRIRVLCSEGRIDGAIKVGHSWSIPSDAVKPVDGRQGKKKKYLGVAYDFGQIDAMKERIDAFRPFSKNLSKSFHEKMLVEWTYNTNAIEGNTLTISETKVVLEGMAIGGKSMIEHQEVMNHRDAILFVEDQIAAEGGLTEWHIKNTHALILKEIDRSHAGAYRKENVLVSGAKHMPPKHYEINDLMQKLIKEYDQDWIKYHPLVRASLLHGEFAKIHPFIDCNGKIARLLLNYELMRNGYTPIIVNHVQRASYYEALDYAHTTMNYGPFMKLLADLLTESEMLWLSVLE